MGASQGSMNPSYSSYILTSSDRPLRLVYLDEEMGRMRADLETLSILRGLNLPVVVVGAVGPYGSGKSSLLTTFMQTLAPGAKGFPSYPSPDPCTQGLWISSRALVPTEGRPHAVLFLDTQGLFSPCQQRRDMCFILTLAILLSSVLIYNEPGCISSCSMDLLTLSGIAAGLVRAHRRVEGHANKAVTALSKCSPTLFWVLRDASFGEGASPGTHQMRVTAHVNPEENQPESYGNASRRIFCQLFPARRCFTMVRPVTEEQQLNSLNDVPPTRYRASFARDLQELGTALREAAKPRVADRVMLSGPLLAALCEAYVAATNEGAIHPYLWQNAMEYVMHEQAVGEEGRVAQLPPTLRDIEIPSRRRNIAKILRMTAVASVMSVVCIEVGIRTGFFRAVIRGIRSASCAVGNWINTSGVVLKEIADELAAQQRRRDDELAAQQRRRDDELAAQQGSRDRW